MEKFVDIAGLEGKYQVSNTGRVKSLSRQIGQGRGYNMPEMILKIQFDSDGYPMVNLSVGSRRTKSYLIHRLVAGAFISDNLPSGHHICHIDGNKLNNSVENLYIGDVVTNSIDKYIQRRTKLSPEDVKTIRGSSEKQSILAKHYGVAQSYISRIKSHTRATVI